ncbi:MAG: P-II family nitrogen regulator [Clostridia bacterium]|nr:P-II family nitrogen regulator [Clostridia bacterium]
MSSKHEVILCIVNEGYSDDVMDAAKRAGARGGTILHGRGTANKESEQFFNIPITPEKDMVMLLVSSKIKDGVLHEIYKSAGLATPGQGIAFAIEVSGVAGVKE